MVFYMFLPFFTQPFQPSVLGSSGMIGLLDGLRWRKDPHAISYVAIVCERNPASNWNNAGIKYLVSWMFNRNEWETVAESWGIGMGSQPQAHPKRRSLLLHNIYISVSCRFNVNVLVFSIVFASTCRPIVRNWKSARNSIQVAHDVEPLFSHQNAYWRGILNFMEVLFLFISLYESHAGVPPTGPWVPTGSAWPRYDPWCIQGVRRNLAQNGERGIVRIVCTYTNIICMYTYTICRCTYTCIYIYARKKYICMYIILYIWYTCELWCVSMYDICSCSSVCLACTCWYVKCVCQHENTPVIIIEAQVTDLGVESTAERIFALASGLAYTRAQGGTTCWNQFEMPKLLFNKRHSHCCKDHDRANHYIYIEH